MPNSDTKGCISCRQPWKRVPRARRSWISSTGKRDSLLLWCEACYSKRTTAINSNPCDQEEEELDTPPLPSKIVSFKALKEELRLLGQQPEWSHFSIVINHLWQGEDEGMRSICAQLSTLIHKHTGYKFTSRNIRNSKRHLTTTFQLQCIQRDTNHMAAQRHRSDLLNISSVIRMERFPCNGWGKAVFHHRPRQVSLHLSHQTAHPPYMNTTIPVKWAEYIAERQDWDPDTLWDKIVNENKRSRGKPLPFTKHTLKCYLGKLIRKNKEKNRASSPSFSSSDLTSLDSSSSSDSLSEPENSGENANDTHSIMPCIDEAHGTTVSHTTMSFAVFEEELRLLGQQPDWKRFSAVVHDLWKGEGEEIRAIGLKITALIHEHTGYRFDSTNLRHAKTKMVTNIYSHCKQRDTDHMATQRLRSDILTSRQDYRMERFPCHGAGKLIFDHQSHQVYVQLSHRMCHPPYMSTSIPAKWAEYIIKRENWNTDTLWNEIVNENERSSGGPLLFTKQTVRHYLKNKVKKSKRKRASSTSSTSSASSSDLTSLDSLSEFRVCLEDDDDADRPYSPPAFMSEYGDATDVEAWTNRRGLSRAPSPSIIEDEENDAAAQAPIVSITCREGLEEINEGTCDEERGRIIKAALELWTSLGANMDPHVLEAFDEGILNLKNALHRQDQRSRTS